MPNKGVSYILRNELGDTLYKKLLMEPLGKEYLKIQERRNKIQKYKLVDWDGGNKFETRELLNKHTCLIRLKKRIGFPEDIKRKAFERADWKCEICGNEFALHVHHVIWRSRGGSNTLNNADGTQQAMVLCAEHHSQMHPMNAQLRESARRQMRTVMTPTRELRRWRMQVE